jgi:3-hydroxyacyl-CoA dehydrogenase/enoyl-CoA hydratase/3-hydroxybutyryl-CoA epimerase
MSTESPQKESSLSIERRDDGVAVVWMDRPKESVNSLHVDFMDEFHAVFDELEADRSVRGVVFASRKKDFLVGADIKMLQKAASGTAREATAMGRAGQAAMDRVEGFRVPVVAAINGNCLGGGFELALACRGRVAAEDAKVGLPESQLGLLPGAGGTQRLPRLTDVQTALDMMLTGKHVRAKKAKKLGLVDEVVPSPILVDVSAGWALKLVDAGPRKAAPRGTVAEQAARAALEQNPVGRLVLFDQARKQLRKKTRGNYPAQERILDVVRTGLDMGLEKGMAAEAEAFGELVVSPEAAQLTGIFMATRAMAKDSGVDDPNVEARPVERVGMLGAGLMGAGIAYVSAMNGLPVRLKDRDAEGVAAGLKYVRRILDKRVARKRMAPIARDRVMTSIAGTVDYTGFEHLPVVIEAVFESLELKHRVLREVEEAGRDEVIFASNTSSIPITKIAEASKHPETVIGMHYFSPVEKMPLLEIITTKQTADWVTATCVEIGKRQRKTVIVVNDGVGFYTSRILGPLMNEAAFVLSEGAPIEEIDQALVDWGFPVGPITLLDEVGIDVAEKVGGIVQEAFGDRMKAPEGFAKLVADGRSGRKNGRGFYLYELGKRGAFKKVKGAKIDESVYELLGLEPRSGAVEIEDIAQRCALAFVNEASRCFGEGILRSARDGDIGAVFGLGFPPFRGGPFRYVDTVGPKEIVRRLSRYRDRLGFRFQPAPVLVEMAESNLTFHGERRVEPGRHAESDSAVAAAPAPT